MKSNKTILTIFFAFVLICGANSASAQQTAGIVEDSSARLEEVIVVARKREESVQEIPISLSTFSADRLSMQSIVDTRDLARFTPNLMVSHTLGGANQGVIYMRGVGEFDVFPTQDPAVGVYVDGVYLGRTQASVLDVLDLDRVEVLRGPQGTLFGRNAIGGAINYVSAMPQTELKGKVQMTYGNNDHIELGGSVDIPLADDVAFLRLSGKHIQRDCLSRTLNRNDCIAGVDTDIGRLSLTWFPSDAVTVNLIGDYTNDNSSIFPWSLRYFDETGAVPQLHNAAVATGVMDGFQVAEGLGIGPMIRSDNPSIQSSDPYVIEMDVTTATPTEAYGVAGTVNWEINELLELVWVSAYRSTETTLSFDADATASVLVQVETGMESKQFSQELRLEGMSPGGRLKWIGGLYYFDEEPDYFEVLYIPVLGEQGEVHPLVDVQALAGFAHLSLGLAEKWTLDLGARYSHEKKKVHFRRRNVQTDAEDAWSIFNYKRSDTWDDFSPKVSISYDLDAERMLYAAFSKGFRSGGYNGRAAHSAETAPADPEDLYSYEVGFKSLFLDRRVRLNLAGFFSKYKNRQLTLAIIDPNTDLIFNTIENAAEAEIKGFEMELEALVTDNLVIEAAVGLADATYTQFDRNESGLTVDSAYQWTPEWTASASVDYRVPLPSGALRARVDYSYRDRVDFQAIPTAFTYQSPLNQWNARLVYTAPDGRWKLSLWGRNLSDKVYSLNGFDAPFFGFAVGTFTEGREYGLTLQFNN